MENQNNIDVSEYAQNRFNQVFINKNNRKFYAIARRIVKDNTNSLNNHSNVIDWYICDDYILLPDSEKGFVQHPISHDKIREVKRYIQSNNNFNNLNVILKYINIFQTEDYNVSYDKNVFFETCINGITIGFPCDNNSAFLKNIYNTICNICNIKERSYNLESELKNLPPSTVMNLIKEIDKEIEELTKEEEKEDLNKEIELNNKKRLEIESHNYISVKSYASPMTTSDEFFQNNINYLVDLSESKIYTERYNGKYNEIKFLKLMNEDEKKKITDYITINSLLDYKIDNFVMDAGDSINVSIDGKKNRIENASSKFTSGKIILFDNLKKLISNMISEGEK